MYMPVPFPPVSGELPPLSAAAAILRIVIVNLRLGTRLGFSRKWLRDMYVCTIPYDARHSGVPRLGAVYIDAELGPST